MEASPQERNRSLGAMYDALWPPYNVNHLPGFPWIKYKRPAVVIILYLLNDDDEGGGQSYLKAFEGKSGPVHPCTDFTHLCGQAYLRGPLHNPQELRW